MSQLAEKEQCTGCTACASICQTGAIQMKRDSEGFLYPMIETSACVQCGACEKVCPALSNSLSLNITTEVFAVKHLDDEVRRDSSSGGVFYALAKNILEKRGAVYGAAFSEDCRKVCTIRVDKEEQIEKLQGSKYLQSDLRGVYPKVSDDLKEKRAVLFVGTPCQVAGLRSYLEECGVSQERLYVCDLICHGAPSPLVWECYLEDLQKKHDAQISKVFFRHKEAGWHEPTKVRYQCDGQQGLLIDGNYTDLFLNDLISRPSCYQCQYARLERPSDITLGDFWGIEDSACKDMDDNIGVSIVLPHTKKGRGLFEEVAVSFEVRSVSLEEGVRGQKVLHEPFPKPEKRDVFWNDFYSPEKLDDIYQKYTKNNRETKRADGLPCADYLVIMPDGTGSKGDEALARGVLNFLSNEDALFITPRKEIWSEILLDRKDEFRERYVELSDLKEKMINSGKMLIVGTDVIDGTCGLESSLYRLEAAEKMLQLGGTVKIFCSFRSDVREEIAEKIEQLVENKNLQFLLRDEVSIQNFKNRFGKEVTYFPDFAFFCEAKETLRVKRAIEVLKEKKAQGYCLIGVNFSETSFSSFYHEKTMQNRYQYVYDLLREVGGGVEKPYFVLISHDSRHWENYCSDADYQKISVLALHNLETRDYLHLEETITHAELLVILKELDTVISGRMHLSIATFRSGNIPIVYTGAGAGGKFSMAEKVRGMFRGRIGDDRFVVTELAKLDGVLVDLLSNKAALQERLFKTSEKNAKHDYECRDVLRLELGIKDKEKQTYSKELLEQKLFDQLVYMENLKELRNGVYRLRGDCAKLNKELEASRGFAKQLQKTVTEKEDSIIYYERQLQQVQDKLLQAQGELQQEKIELQKMKMQFEEVTNSYHTVLNSRAWKITAPMRKAMDCIKRKKG